MVTVQVDDVKILEKKIKLNKIVYKIELEGEEKFWSSEQVFASLNEPRGFPYIVTRFENTAQVVIYMD